MLMTVPGVEPSDEANGMSHRRELLDDTVVESRFEVYLDRRLEMPFGPGEPAWHRDCRSDVEAGVDKGRHELGVNLRLGVGAHRTCYDPRTPVQTGVFPEEHPRHER